MGAEATLSITRTAARKYLLGKIMEATDLELSDLLYEFLAERLYNAMIVSDDEPNNDDDTL